MSREKGITSEDKSKKESNYKGVAWSTVKQRWVAKYYLDGETHWVGAYKEERAAAIAYDKKCIRLGIKTELNILKRVDKK